MHRHFGAESAIYPYGSRTEDQARGSDVDVFVETVQTIDCHQRAHALAALEDALHLPVDLLVKDTEDRDRPIHRIAHLTGQHLQ